MTESPIVENEIKYKLLIPSSVYQQILAYVDGCPVEISGLGDVEFDIERGAFIMSKVYLVEQECTATSTVMEGDALNQLSYDLTLKEHTQMPRLWWHSHAKMGVFWSATDVATMLDFRNDNYTIALEFNHEHKYLCRVLQWRPFPTIIDNVEIEVIHVEIDKTPFLEEVKQKVKEINYTDNINDKKDEAEWLNEEDKDSIKVYKNFPKDKEAILRKVRLLNLCASWDGYKKQIVWKDPYAKEVWIDENNLLGFND